MKRDKSNEQTFADLKYLAVQELGKATEYVRIKQVLEVLFPGIKVRRNKSAKDGYTVEWPK